MLNPRPSKNAATNAPSSANKFIQRQTLQY